MNIDKNLMLSTDLQPMPKITSLVSRHQQEKNRIGRQENYFIFQKKKQTKTFYIKKNGKKYTLELCLKKKKQKQKKNKKQKKKQKTKKNKNKKQKNKQKLGRQGNETNILFLFCLSNKHVE